MRLRAVATVTAALFVCVHAAREPDLTNTRVHVPWSDFQRIVDRLMGARAQRPTDTLYAPVDYAVAACRLEGNVVDRTSAQLTARVTVHVLPGRDIVRGGWALVPLGRVRGATAVLERVLVDGAPASVDQQDDAYYLLLPKTGVYTVDMRYHCPLKASEGSFELQVNLPGAVAASLDFLVPGRHAEIQVNGTRRDAAFSREGTRVTTAIPGAMSTLRVSYTPLEEPDEAGEAAQMTPKVFAETGLLVGIKENRITYRCRVDYEIWHRKRTSFALLLPDTFPVENITGPGLAQWDITATDSGQLLSVKTSYAPEREWSLTVDYSQKLETAEALLTVPVPRVLDVNRESGSIAVQASPTMEVSTGDSSSQVSSVAPSELPSWLRNESGILMRLKYNRRPFRLDLAVKRHKDMPVLVAVADEALFTVLQSREGYRVAKYRYFIRNNQKQYLRVAMPEQWALWSALIDGRAVMPATADSADAVLLPLKKSSGEQDEGFTLELVYWNADKAMGRGGAASVPTPVIDINCQKTNLELWVPQRYRYRIKPEGFEATGYFSSGRLSSEQQAWDSGAATRRQRLRRDYVPVQSNTFMMAKKGKALALPVEIEIPKDGVVKRFSRGLTVAGEKAGLRVRYRKAMPGIQKFVAVGFWLTVVTIAFASTRSVLRAWGRERVRGTVIASVAAVFALMFVNVVAHADAEWLFSSAVLSAGCAFLGQLAFESRKEARS
jgi:hypothetical protein